MIKIILAEDHHIVRKGIRLLISEDPEIEILAEAANGEEVLKALAEFPEAEIVLADLNMPVMNGHDLLQAVKRDHPSVKMIVLSMVDDHKVVAELMAKGASGYLLKNAEAMELIFALKFAASGNRYICAGIGLELVASSAADVDKINLQQNIKFSDRELDVLKLISEGLTNNEIANIIFASKRTVEGHRQSLLEKTGSKNTAVLIRNAILSGLI